MNQSRDLKILEAILFASTEPVLENDLKERIINKDLISSMLNEIQNIYSKRRKYFIFLSINSSCLSYQ